MKKKIARLLRRKLFRALPEKLRHELIRAAIQVPQVDETDYCFKLAETADELRQAYALLHDCYVEQKFIHPLESRLRILPHFVLPTSVTLVSVHRTGEVVGTLSIIGRGPLPLPMEKQFSIAHIKNQGGRYAEISALAVKREYRRVNGGSIFYFMLNFMYHYCVDQLNVRFLCIAIHPKDEDFYAGLLFFRRLPDQNIVHYMGAPALAMYLDLDHALTKFSEVYSPRAKNKNLLEFFMTRFDTLTYIRRPYRLNSFSTVTPEIFAGLFLEEGKFFDQISFSESKILKRALLSTNLHSFFKDDSVDELSRRAEFRVTVSMKGKALINDCVTALNVVEVSGNGLHLDLSGGDAPPLTQEGLGLVLDLGEGITSNVTGKIVWGKHPYYGVRLQAYDSHWQDFVNYLYRGRQNYIFKSS